MTHPDDARDGEPAPDPLTEAIAAYSAAFSDAEPGVSHSLTEVGREASLATRPLFAPVARKPQNRGGERL